ncbi:hypothetical protein JYU34_011263 [Plutella xylostella]|uniref:Uncharacterized protein n=1 Tax=Plutella xylostella TaxID=51655 RepID=A0ABQ7QHB3_PLUXY|nr:hypothetical protein JYU34_011263 [Plutella xylostella]
MALASFCALGITLLLQSTFGAIVGGTNNGNANQNNQLLSLVMQSLANNNNNGLNVNPSIAAANPINCNQQIDVKRQQNSNNNVANLALAQNSQPLDISLANPALSGQVSKNMPIEIKCPQTAAAVANWALQSQNNQAPLTSLNYPAGPAQTTLSTNPAVINAVRNLLAKSCSCNQVNEQPVSGGSQNKFTFPVTFVNKQTGNPIPMKLTPTGVRPEQNQQVALLAQSNYAPAQPIVQNQPSVVLGNQPCSNALGGQPLVMSVEQQPRPQQQPQPQPQQQPSFSIVLCPPSQPGAPAPAQPCAPAATNYYQPSVKYSGSKKSSLKKILPLLFDLLNEKDGCMCGRGCGCGYCGGCSDPGPGAPEDDDEGAPLYRERKSNKNEVEENDTTAESYDN